MVTLRLIAERETEMEVGDCSLWHYLIFCEEFVNDDCKKDFVCWVCKESVLGHPTFKCLECSFVQHKSCTHLLDLTEMNVKHDIKDKHHLILRKETEEDGKKEEVCAGCGKLAPSPAYRCSIPNCAFHLHKSCDQLSHAILHNAHPDHTLILALPPLGYYCDLCNKDRKNRRTTLAYGCRLCNFDMDNKCASRWDVIESERKMEAGDCSIWHYLIFCEEFVSDDYKNDVICWVCEELVSGHPAFKCLECGFVQHKSCTQLLDLTKMNVKHDIENRHHLILQETEDDSKKKVDCVVCGRLASSPTYKCSINHCAFHLHKSCDQLSHAILHNAHPDHTLILCLPPLYYHCNFCSKYRKKRRTTLLYSCHLCSFDIDNKCLTQWDLILSERKMEVEDYSIWHYLIFCEEFVGDDNKNDVVCWVCEESVLGHSAFKCLECGFLQHKSCTQLPDLIEMNVKHDIMDKHHLILREEMKNNEKEKAVCIACWEVASGPTYICSIPQCTIHLHRSCDQLSHVINHIEHPEHTLILKLLRDRFCDLCGESFDRGTILLYHCSVCQFDMDKNCAFPLTIIDVDCDKHAFISCRKSIPFTCEACGVEAKDVAYQCRNCGVLTHPYCANYPRTININAHHHSFLRTYCLCRVKKLEKAICKLCCKKVNTECGAYYCQVCDYIVHMKCAKRNEDKSNINLKEDYRRHLVYLVEGLNTEVDKAVDIPSKINHTNHPQHELILKSEDSANNKQLYKNDRRCAVCMQFIIFPNFYSCEGCNIFVHKRCAKLPKTVMRPLLDKNQYTLSSHLLSSIDYLFRCRICNNYCHGLFYESGYERIDVKCFLFPEYVSHKCHEHLLLAPILPDPKLNEICIGCGGEIDGWTRYFMCTDCKLWFCFKCATLPLVARYKYHPHLLKLTYTWEDDLEECYCLICEEDLDSKHWFYSCADCNFSTHLLCVIGSSLKGGRHQHPVILVETRKGSLKCDLCKKIIRDYEKALECTQCKFNFHLKCYY